MKTLALVAVASVFHAAAGLALSQDKAQPATPSKPAQERAAQPVDDGYRRTFTVAKANLGPAGGNRFFDLTPGAKHTYHEDKLKLTITVLDESRRGWSHDPRG